MGPGQEALGIAGAEAEEAVVHPLSSAKLCPVPSSSYRTRMFSLLPQTVGRNTPDWRGDDSGGRVLLWVGGGGAGVSKRQYSFAACSRKSVILPLQLGTEEVPEMPPSGQFSAGTLSLPVGDRRHCLGNGWRKGQWS